MRFIRSTKTRGTPRKRRKFLVPLLIATISTISLQACTPEVIRGLEPAFVIPYEADPVRIANCAVDIYITTSGKDIYPIIVPTGAHVRITATDKVFSTYMYVVNLVWEALLQDGEAQVRQFPAIIDWGEPIALAIEDCNKQLLSSD
ncbi:MAG: hypothetical protein HOI02_02095 [Rhodospirillaceae bacterium]|jgi:hypothetical protein|nr:hypothetical protein [Rhodospirillaceae bacterium]